jgi:abequosyltransferase
MKQLKLSICIATYNRGRFIGETLDSIISQLVPGVELIVVDGASPDNTQEVMAIYSSRHPQIRYYRESENSGVDRDYDKAVGYAIGKYCWLMTDDDLLRPGAVKRILAELDGLNDIVIANAEVRSADLSMLLIPSRLNLEYDHTYNSGESDIFFAACMRYISFIGSVIVKRELWLSRERSYYYGSLFIHVGVICQKPLLNPIRVITEPLIVIRFGNAMWTPRGFEIWMFKWPQLIWSFQGFSDQAKSSVCPENPSNSPARLFYFRALGAYGISEFRKYMSSRTGFARLLAYAISRFPSKLANLICVISLCVFKRTALMALYDLSLSSSSTVMGRFLVRTIHGKFTLT